MVLTGIETVSELNSVRSISESIPKTRVCFVTPGTFKSSVLALRHVTNFDIPWLWHKERKGLERRRGLPRGHSEEKGWLVIVLTRFCGCRGGVFDLSPSLRFHPLSTCITLHPAFFFLLRLAFSPYKYTPSRPSVSSLRRTLPFPSASVAQPTVLPSSYPFSLFSPAIFVSFSRSPSLSVSFSISRSAREQRFHRVRSSPSLAPPPDANTGGRGRKGMTRRTGLSNPHPRNDKTPVEG